MITNKSTVAASRSLPLLTTMSSLETNMRTTTEAFLSSFNGDWQPTATLSLRSADCKHTFLPASLGTAPKSKDEWAAYFKNVAPLIKGAKVYHPARSRSISESLPS